MSYNESDDCKSYLINNSALLEDKTNLYSIANEFIGHLEKVLTLADRRLATSTYIASSQFTLADVTLGYCLFRYYDIDIVRAELPNLRRYYDLLTTRPAFQQHVMVPYDELRA